MFCRISYRLTGWCDRDFISDAYIGEKGVKNQSVNNNLKNEVL